MITLNSEGTELSSIVKNRLRSRVLNEDNGPREQIIFSRKLPSLITLNQHVWSHRDVTSMFFNADSISKSIADNYGTSKGSEVSVVFDNTPIPAHSVALQVEGKIQNLLINTDHLTRFEAGDWVEISDYENVEYRRIGSVDIHTTDPYTEIALTEPLDNDFNIPYTEVRFLFAIHNNKNRLDSYDLYNGFLQMNLGFEGEGDYITLFQGEITGGARDPNNTVTLTLQDRVKSLVETQLEARFEVDDRGVASVPTPKGWNGEITSKESVNVFGSDEIRDIPNVGTGEISDVTYSPEKFKEIEWDNEWVITYHAGTDSFFWNGNQLLSNSDGSFGTLDGDGVQPVGPHGKRVWEIDLTDDIGWGVTITEGDIPFESGDQFVFYTRKYVEDMCHIVKGRGFAESPILTLDQKYLNPSYIIEMLLVQVLGLTHENVVTGTSTTLLKDIDSIRQLDLDFRTELRGIFSGGTSVIQVVDDALRTINGWLYSTHDDHLAIFCYSPFAFGDYDNLEISTDYNAPAPRSTTNYPNAADPQSEPRLTDSVRNQIFFSYTGGQVFVDDPDSQEQFGRFKLDVRGEDLITHSISSEYEITSNTARNAAHRAIHRFKNPIFRAMLVGMPELLLLEIGDIPRLFSREVQFVNKPFWVTGLEVDYTALTVKITGELATQIEGKFGRAHSDNTPEAASIWGEEGFIGQEGDERLAYLSNDSENLQLDGIRHPNNDVYDERVGTPDRWGNYIEDPFVIA